MSNTVKTASDLTLTRRGFLKAGCACAALLAAKPAFASKDNVVTLLHTNDTHSRIEPFEDGENKGKGGVARRAKLINDWRSAHPNTLLVDAGDIFQGTPYFNQFGGRVEFEAMSAMGYDLATYGNHDFDRGTEGLSEMLDFASFEFVSTTLTITNSKMRSRTAPYRILEVAGRRIGFFGLTVAFSGLVAEKNHRGVEWNDPLPAAQKAVQQLRQEKVSAVIAITHLGVQGAKSKIGDFQLAQQVKGIDVIIGGHSHTLLDKPLIATGPDNWQTAIVQVGHSGLHLGRVDLHFKDSSLAAITCGTTAIA